MKNEKDIFTQGAGIFSVGAAANARMRNVVNKHQFSYAEQTSVGCVEMAMHTLYNFDNLEVNYRPGKISKGGIRNSKFISIKIAGGRVKNNKVLTGYESGLDTSPTFKKVEKRRNPNTDSIIYRFYF